MKKGTVMKRPIKRLLPTGRKAWSADVKETELGALLKRTRVDKQIAQKDIAAALHKKVGGGNANVRVSAIELGKKSASDEELAVFSSMLGLSLPTLRGKRDADLPKIKAHAARSYEAKKQKKAKLTAPKGKPGPKPNGHAAQDPAGSPAIADWIEMIDGIAPMPADKDDRKRWFAATMELFKIGGGT